MQTWASWPIPGGVGDEMALCFDAARRQRLLVIPALLEEAPRMRRFTVEVMRRLDRAGIDSFLPDLPGCNESLAPLAKQTPDSWQQAMSQAARHFRATHLLTIRGGALVAPGGLPGWRYAAMAGASQARHLLRARIVAAHEAGREETQEILLARDRAEGLKLAGMQLGAGFLTGLMQRTPAPDSRWHDIPQDRLTSSPGLWLRVEAGEDAAQADALTAMITGST